MDDDNAHRAAEQEILERETNLGTVFDDIRQLAKTLPEGTIRNTYSLNSGLVQTPEIQPSNPLPPIEKRHIGHPCTMTFTDIDGKKHEFKVRYTNIDFGIGDHLGPRVQLSELYVDEIKNLAGEQSIKLKDLIPPALVWARMLKAFEAISTESHERIPQMPLREDPAHGLTRRPSIDVDLSKPQVLWTEEKYKSENEQVDYVQHENRAVLTQRMTTFGQDLKSFSEALNRITNGKITLKQDRNPFRKSGI